MKTFALVFSLLAVAAPAHAQLGGLIRGIQKATDQARHVDDLRITDAEQRTIGEDVSLKVRQRYGVVQDEAVHRYVTLVGTLVARESDKPDLDWTFIVLDTDGVNAFASPGGFVHVTRGALGLIKNEAELAAVLAHEVTHVSHEHAMSAIRKMAALELGTEQVLADRQATLDAVVNRLYDTVLDSSFSRDDELDADGESVDVLEKLGYAPSALADFLARLADRNKEQLERNGLFASHPETTERIARIRRAAGSKRGSIVDARYAANITYVETPLTLIAAAPDEISALTGATKAPASAPAGDTNAAQKPEQPRRRGFGLGALRQAVAPEKQSAQVTASGGARGVGVDRLARGGEHPNIVPVTLTADELAEFKRGIA